jgi:hypothetical protein
VWLVGVGLAGFLAGLLIAVAMKPEGIGANRGFSYYGDQPETIALYWLAFLLIGGSLLLAPRWLPRAKPFAAMRTIFRTMCALLTGVLLTTVSDGGRALVLAHQGFGVALFVLEIALVSWLAFRVCRDRANLALFAALVVAGVVSLLALLNLINCLIFAQVAFQLVFGALLIRTLIHLRPRPGSGA